MVPEVVQFTSEPYLWESIAYSFNIRLTVTNQADTDITSSPSQDNFAVAVSLSEDGTADTAGLTLVWDSASQAALRESVPAGSRVTLSATGYLHFVK